MSRVRVRLLFADEGAFHHERISVESKALKGHERLIDALREEPSILKETWIDVDRLVSATVVGEDEDDDD